MRWTQEELALGLSRNALQRDPSLNQQGLAGLVGCVLKKIPDQGAYGPFEAEQAFEVLRDEQNLRGPRAAFETMVKAVQAEADARKPATPLKRRRPEPPTPTAAQLAKHEADLQRIATWGSRAESARRLDRQGKIRAESARAEAKATAITKVIGVGPLRREFIVKGRRPAPSRSSGAGT